MLASDGQGFSKLETRFVRKIHRSYEQTLFMVAETRIASHCTRFADWAAADVRGVPVPQVPLAHSATAVVRLDLDHIVVVEPGLEYTGAS